jgi:hypothetical protein
VGLERGALSLVSIIKELLERKSSGSGLESREYSHRDLSHSPHDTLCPQKLALTSLTSGGLSVGIVFSRTQATEFSLWVTCLVPSIIIILQHITWLVLSRWNLPSWRVNLFSFLHCLC